MPRRDPDLLIEDILSAVRKIERYTSSMDPEGFRQDEKTGCSRTEPGDHWRGGTATA